MASIFYETIFFDIRPRPMTTHKLAPHVDAIAIDMLAHGQLRYPIVFVQASNNSFNFYECDSRLDAAECLLEMQRGSFTGLCGYIGVASMIVLDSGTPVECVTIEIMGLVQDTVHRVREVRRDTSTNDILGGGACFSVIYPSSESAIVRMRDAMTSMCFLPIPASCL